MAKMIKTITRKVINLWPGKRLKSRYILIVLSTDRFGFFFKLFEIHRIRIFLKFFSYFHQGMNHKKHGFVCEFMFIYKSGSSGDQYFSFHSILFFILSKIPASETL